MTSVFISYSTVDAEIGQKLYNALLEQKRDVWMDWKSIALTADWWNEIKDGIETSDNFVFLVSPNSIGSPICHLEIQYAHSLNKRMIPVLITPTDERAAFADLLTRDLNELQRALLGKQDLIDLARDNWKLLSSIQWINLARDGFDSGAHQLSEAIDTDLDYIQEHTRLLLRAKDWFRRGKTPSLLLRGDDLIAAEAWMKTAAAMKPPATDDHKTYITESRRDEDERSRIAAEQERRTRELETQTQAAAVENTRLAKRTRAFRIASVGLAIVGAIALIFAVISAISASNSQQRADAANTQAAIAQLREDTANTQVAVANATLTVVADEIQNAQRNIDSVRLSSQALEIYANDLDNRPLALALALAASEIALPVQTERVLRQFSYEPGIRLFLPNSVFLTYSPDKQFMLARERDCFSCIELLDAHTGELINRYVTRVLPPTESITGAAFSPDENRALAWTDQGSLLSWNLQNDSVLFPYRVAISQPISHAEYHPSGDTYAVILGNEIREYPSESIIPEYTLEGHTVLEYSPDGAYIAAAYAENEAVIWNRATQAIEQRLEGHTGEVVSLDYSPNGEYLVSGSTDQSVIVWNVSTGEVVRQFEGHNDEIVSSEFYPDERHVLSSDRASRVLLWDIEAGSIVQELSLGTSPLFRVSADASSLQFATLSNALMIWDMPLRSRTIERQIQLRSSQGWYDGVVFDPIENLLYGCAGGSQVGYLYAWDANTGESVHEYLGMPGAHCSLELIRHTAAATVEETQQNRPWSIFLSLQSYGSSFRPAPLALAYSDNYEFMVTGEAGGTVILRSLPSMTFHDPEITISAVDVRSDRSQVAGGGTITRDGSLRGRINLWNVESNQIEYQLEEDAPFSRIIYSPDGSMLAAGTWDGRLMLWDSISGTLIRNLDGHSDNINALTFNADGTRLVSASNDTTIIIWDTNSGEIIDRLYGHTTGVLYVHYSTDNAYLISTSSDGVVIFWRNDTPDQLRAWIRENRYLPTLTCQQKITFGLENTCSA